MNYQGNILEEQKMILENLKKSIWMKIYIYWFLGLEKRHLKETGLKKWGLVEKEMQKRVLDKQKKKDSRRTADDARRAWTLEGLEIFQTTIVGKKTKENFRSGWKMSVERKILKEASIRVRKYSGGIENNCRWL